MLLFKFNNNSRLSVFSKSISLTKIAISLVELWLLLLTFWPKFNSVVIYEGFKFEFVKACERSRLFKTKLNKSLDWFFSSMGLITGLLFNKVTSDDIALVLKVLNK